MAFLELIVQGSGSSPARLPVEVVAGLPLSFSGLESKSVQFRITNSLSNTLVLDGLTVKVEGPAASKINAVLRFDTLTISAGGTADNFIDAESTEHVYKGELFSIIVEWNDNAGAPVEPIFPKIV